ncbi:MAG: hypothetical protein HOP17_07465 [Acidobacteria bacterium]|nr:hypothetical protein [Acidobacteriota bacterium]
MDIATVIFNLIILSICVASIAWTVTQEEIFSEWRDAFQHWSEKSPFLLVRKFCYVWTCEYCFSHWVTLLVLLLTGFKLLIDDWRGYVLAFFVLPWLANQWMSIYRRLRVGIKHENLLAEKVKEKIESD